VVAWCNQVGFNGKTSITADMAARIGKMTRTSPRFWLGIQNSYDLSQLDMSKYDKIETDQSMQVVGA
jgi:plasmid maintenance system antidote protein VapI